MKKITISILACILLIGLGLIMLIAQNLDAIVKKVIEDTSTKVTGSETTLGGVELSIKEGKATIRDFHLQNPTGYSDSTMISFGEITAQVNYETGAIENLLLADSLFYIEVKGASSNFSAVLDHIESITPTDSSATEEPATVITIDAFSINNATAQYFIVDTDQRGDLTLDEIHFEDLSGTPDEITTIICKTLVKHITAEVVNKQLDALKEGVKEGLGTKIKGIFKDDDEAKEEE